MRVSDKCRSLLKNGSVISIVFRICSFTNFKAEKKQYSLILFAYLGYTDIIDVLFKHSVSGKECSLLRTTSQIVGVTFSA